MDTAAGLALCGKVVFASTFAIFACRAWEHIRNTIAHSGLNVKIVATHSGLSVGEDGSSHQALEDIALMRAMPNMLVLSPADAGETKESVKAAAELKGPAYIRLCRPDLPVLPAHEFSIGKAVVLRDGSDATLVATGIMVHACMEAAGTLAKQGIDAAVINMHTIKPLDVNILLRYAKLTGKIFTCEDHSIYGGLGSAVAEALSEEYPVPVKRIGMQCFGESGSCEELFEKHGMTAEHIATHVIEAVE